MPAAALNTLRRETAQLREQLGASGTTIHPAYVLIDEDGTESAPVDLHGAPIVPDDHSVVFRVLAAPFRLLAEGARHTLLPHGRGAGISTTIAYYTIGLALTEPCRILAAREVQVSLKDSVHHLLKSIIEFHAPLSAFFDIQRDVITSRNGSEFAFKGVRSHTVDAIKSSEAIRYLWAEESQSLSRESIETLIYTVREHGARCFWSWNPRNADDPVGTEFDGDREDVARPETPFTLKGNPLASDTLREEAERLRQRDPERYSHIIGGNIRSYAEARVFSNYLISPDPIDVQKIIDQRIESIRVGYSGTAKQRRDRRSLRAAKVNNAFAVGCDIGYTDPFTIVMAYVDSDTDRLFVLREFYRVGLDPDQMVQALQSFPMPTEQWPVYVDNSRPELIRLFQKRDINAHPSVKLPLQERVDGLKRFSIFIDPSCEHTAREFALYEWETDAQGVVIGDKPSDKNNHTIDSLAYALGETLKARPPGQYRVLSDPFT